MIRLMPLAPHPYSKNFRIVELRQSPVLLKPARNPALESSPNQRRQTRITSCRIGPGQPLSGRPARGTRKAGRVL